MAKVGRPMLSIEEKIRRGTLVPGRERKRAAALGPAPVAPTLERPVQKRDYVEIARTYAEDVVAGRVVAGKWVRLAAARQLRDLAAAEADPSSLWLWSAAEAENACWFVECCPHVKGDWGSPFIRLEAFQVFLTATFFGWRRRADPRRRRFTTLYFEVARKAAKSTLMAAWAFYHLLDEGEPGAQVICGATTGQQARMVFEMMQKMGRRSRWLIARGVLVYANAIMTPDGEAKPVNSKATSLDGLNPSCIVLDESHAQDFPLHDVLKSAQGSRPNPMLLCPTTAGYNLLSVGYALRGQAAKVLEGLFVADHLLAVIYAIDDDDDWRDEAVWPKANPMLGISPKLDWMRTWATDAQQVPEIEGEFKVKGCSLWAASSLSRWISLELWDRCADESLRIEDFVGKDCWVGGDLGFLDDLAAVCYTFLRGEALVAFIRCYLPEGVVAERARKVPAYAVWRQTGILVPTEGTMTDVDRIEADLRADARRFSVKSVVFDQFGSIQLVSRLAAGGLKAVVEPKNARTTTPPARELEGRVRGGKFLHDGSSIFRWAISNCVVRRGIDDTILPKKESAESPNKIDPIDALLWAILGRQAAGGGIPKQYPFFIAGGNRPGTSLARPSPRP